MTTTSSAHDGVRAGPLASGRLRPEAELLVDLARPDPGDDVRVRVRELLSAGAGEMDWAFFVDQAARHGVLPLVGANLNRWRRLAHDAAGSALVPYRWLYSDVHHANRRRNLALFDEYRTVFAELERAGLEFIVRKGPAILHRAYPEPGLRRMADLDVFMDRSTFTRFGEVLESLGYRQGRVSTDGRSIVPFDRAEELYWKTSLRNVSLPYHRLVQRDEIESIILSGCFSLFQPTSGIEDDFADFLARSERIELCGSPARRLDAVDEVLDLCLQLHVEATLFYYIESGKDLTLRKFVDIASCVAVLPVERHPELVGRAAGYGCLDSVYFALHHTGMLYPDSVPGALLASARPADVGYLDDYGTFEGRPGRWETPFPERLFDPRRARGVAERSHVPGPRSSV